MSRRIKGLASRMGLLAAVAALLTPVLIWSAAAQQPDPADPGNPGDQAAQPALIRTDVVGGPERFLTFVSTDKPIYRGGERVYLRGVMLHHSSRVPLAQAVNGVVEIQGPKGDVVASGMIQAEAGVWGYRWDVPAGQSGGEYTVKVSYPWAGYSPAERKFDVRAYRAPRLRSQIKFLRDGYGPGDEVAATLEVERAEGGVPADAPVTVIARVDGTEAFRGGTRVDSNGRCVARFSLPAEIERGEGTLALVIEDGGVVETASKTIPILLQTVDIRLYPEGGELVQGLPCRVYFEAFTPAKKPADLAGEVLDPDGEVVASFRSEHEGRGRFTFTPRHADGYQLRFTEPAGLTQKTPLPSCLPAGVTLRSEKNVYSDSEPVALTLASSESDQVKLTLQQRERQIASKEIQLPAGQPVRVELPVEDEQGDGVLVATVWDGEGRPRAERLVFRQPQRQVNVEITSQAEAGFVPGGHVKLKIKTTDERGRPIAARVGLTVTDDSVLEMIDRREQAPRLPVMALLENEVQELADAHVYFDPENPDADLAVDLLLGVQGWRRFAFVDTRKLLREHGDAGRRILALRMVAPNQFDARWAAPGGFGGFAEDGAVPRRAMLGAAAPEAPPAGAPPLPAAPQAQAGGVPAEGQPGQAGPGEGRAGRDLPADGNGANEAAGVPLANQAGDKSEVELARRPASQPQPADAFAPDADAADRPAARPEELAAEELEREADEVKELVNRELAQALADKQVADRRLRAFGGGGFGGRLGGPAIAVGNDLVAVRVYAHEVRSGRQPGQRVDFSETLFWADAVDTNEQGTAEVEFGLSDAVTTFRVFGDAVDGRGALGSGGATVESVEPFYIEPKLPLEVTMGDTIQAPLGIVNATATQLADVDVQVQAHSSQQLRESKLRPFTLQPGQRARKRLNVTVGDFAGDAKFQLTAASGGYADQVTRQLKVMPRGFPVEDGGGALLSPGGIVAFEVDVPAELVAGSLQTRAAVYPTPLASMSDALERLIREPYGCFEQTSSTTYPLVMAQQYFLSHEGVDPQLIERSAEILDRGYERLLGFESPSHGFEWFGGDPGHDALTAYGLLEFTDMSQVRHVDQAMLERTRNWLLEQRDGKGGYARKTRTLHTWLADNEVAFPYNTWALLEAGISGDLSREVEWVAEAARTTQNSYVIALAANVLELGGDKDGANQLMDKLAGLQAADGSVDGAVTSVVGSGGEALKIETTALAMLAWLKNPSYAEQVEHAIEFLAESCKAGRFGSTQSTVLALRAIVAYDQSRAVPKAPGSVQLWVDDQAVGEPVAFAEDQHGSIVLPDCAELLKPGKHQVEIRMQDGSQMPCMLNIAYNTLRPPSSDQCKLTLEAKLQDQEIDEGASTEVAVAVVNRSNDEVPTPTVIVGIPGGLEVRHDQLKELVKAERIAAYEVRGREVILYWRVLSPEERVELPISVIAAVPGTYTAPASRAYLYYTDEHKTWVPGLKAKITPKQ